MARLAPVLMADPADPVGLSLVADTTIPPALRAELALDVPIGFCGNGRELLFGVDPRRRALLARAELLVRATPRVEDVVRLARRFLDQLIDSTSSVVATLNGTRNELVELPVVLRVPGWIGLHGLRDRLTFCALPP